MALSQPRSIFGIHTVSPYNPTTGEFYGIGRVLGDASFNLSGELVPLNGGSNKYPWAIEEGLITSELSLTLREYPDWVFTLFLGKAPTSFSAEASGNVSTVANVNGTSAVDATTGIASVTATSGDEADLKFGKYIIKVASATTVDIYVSSDIDLTRGTDEEFDDDLLLVEAGLTVSDADGVTAVASLGLDITGGSGTVAMTTGDTAEFEVRPINDGGITVRIGGSNDSFPEFGMVNYAKKRANDELMEIDIFRVKAVGAPLQFSENAWSEAAITAQAYYDSSKNGVADVRFVSAA